MFDVYYADDASKTKEFFYLKLYPEFLPFITVIDPARKQALRVPAVASKKRRSAYTSIRRARKGQRISLQDLCISDA